MINIQANSSHGGSRPGAGRKAGGRNKKTAEILEAVESTGVTPLDYLLSVMRDEAGDKPTRIQAAIAAAPYCHSKLAAVTISGDEDNPLNVIAEVRRVIIKPDH